MGFGIDFGTTNCAVVFDQDVLLDVGGGDRPFPSVVAIENLTGEVMCGPRAKDQRGELAANDWTVVTSVKRQLGKGLVVRAGTRGFDPVDVAAELFRGLAAHVDANAARVRNQKLTEAVVSIPVGFPPDRRRLLREAARRAGITITSFVSEPTAAYLQCAQELGPVERVAVFDWGGGTLDVSILVLRQDRIVELATEGREEAGDDIDLAIATWAHKRIATGGSTGTFDEVTGAARDHLLEACESAKILLSTEPQTNVRLEEYLGREFVSEPIDQATLADLADGFIRRALETLDGALGKARQQEGPFEIDALLLIGGSSRLAALRERMNERYPGKVVLPRHPNWAVAQGASLLSESRGAYELAQRVCLVLSDGSPHVLVRPGDHFDGRSRRYHLGIVEETDSAELVIAEDLDDDRAAHTVRRLRQMENLAVPMQGFWDERLSLEATLTPDLTLRLEAASANGNSADRRSTELSHLRFSYALPHAVSRDARTEGA